VNRHKNIRRATIWLVAQIMLSSALIIALLMVLLYQVLSPSDSILRHPLIVIGIVLFAATVVGSVLTIPLSRHYLKPLDELMAATKAVADGDFSVRIAEDSAIGEFREYIQSFNKMAQSLNSLEMLRTDFINTISHEFKTPVVSIRGFAKLLQNPDLTDEQKKLYTDTIITQSQRLTSMSANILLLSRYENTQTMTGQESYSLDEQIRQCIHFQERAWLQKDIQLSGDLEPITYYGNPDILNHLWSNLLSNAIKFTPQGGAITITLTQTGDTIRATFRDTGIGMDEATQAHIYEKFYQGDRSRQSDGNGLGLSIVWRIVTLCGGTIDLNSAPGQGSEFIVCLPVTQAPENG
jgi:signal transduction histidine kinase